MYRRFAIHAFTLVTVLTVALAACGDGDDSQDPASTPPASTTVPPVASPTADPPSEPGGPSGIAVVDQVIAAVEAGDAEAFMELVIFEPEPCALPAEGLGGPPDCTADELPNTPVEVAPFASCEGYWSRESNLRRTLITLFDRPARLHAVYRAEERIFDRKGEYAVIFELTGGPEGPLGRDVIMTDAGVVGVNFGCGQNVEQMVEFHDLTDAIVEPAEVSTQ